MGEPERRGWQLAEPLDQSLAGTVLVAEQESGLQRDFEHVAHRRDLDQFNGSRRPTSGDKREPTAGRLRSLRPGCHTRARDAAARGATAELAA